MQRTEAGDLKRIEPYQLSKHEMKNRTQPENLSLCTNGATYGKHTASIGASVLCQ